MLEDMHFPYNKFYQVSSGQLTDTTKKVKFTNGYMTERQSTGRSCFDIKVVFRENATDIKIYQHKL